MLKDANCELIVGGPSELAPGKEATYTCTHTLTTSGSYTNEASIEANEGAGTKFSNKVVVKVPPEAKFTIKSSSVLPAKSRTRNPNSPVKPDRRSNTRSSSSTPATYAEIRRVV